MKGIRKGIFRGDVVDFIYNNCYTDNDNRVIVLDHALSCWDISGDDIEENPCLKGKNYKEGTYRYVHEVPPLTKVTSILYGVTE